MNFTMSLYALTSAFTSVLIAVASRLTATFTVAAGAVVDLSVKVTPAIASVMVFVLRSMVTGFAVGLPKTIVAFCAA